MPYAIAVSHEIVGGNCDSKEKILSVATTKPELFKKPRYSGKVVSDEATKTLKEGIAFLETTKDGIIKVGYGSGAMLGGLDKEMRYLPVPKETCEKLKKLSQEYDGLYEKGNLLKYATPEEKKALLREITLDKMNKKPQEEFAKLRDTMKLSTTSLSALPKRKIDVSVFPNTASKLEDAKTENSYFDMDTAKYELKSWGYRLPDIRKVYFSDVFPAVLEMKDGKQIVLAPKLTDVYESSSSLEYHIARRKKDEIRKKMEDVAMKKLGKVIW
jgi:hypothetical protein